MKSSIASYYNQIKKAALRDDYISINHRVAAFLASYFDIVFALNELANPGEKKLMKIVKEICKLVPENFEEDVNYLTKPEWKKEKLIETVESLTINITELLKKEGYQI